ncbi:YSIRK-type signal peptide-containing protein [Streptococcus equi]|uniref:YSIRK-type signal peptide-containing protein n=1 Tax=Streptococcus equi TaxID=1336 RepID=UPI0024A9BF51|nr:YSIRK-type signal peptide-containing protein [Streptococcus equi]MDI5954467.1 YSIRK-type signal peptide-containing protein [Streptococcus equi subsp. zooepidemicus]HEL1111705.1 YSIRK-type signal peptide-containing protein [Streptococcus equi subsp. zooepidemicus]
MFLRNNTNKQYSLRRLKKGTASVAVALSILGVGAGLAMKPVKAAYSEHDVYLKVMQKYEQEKIELTKQLENAWDVSAIDNAEKLKLEKENAELRRQLTEKTDQTNKLSAELQSRTDNYYDLAKQYNEKQQEYDNYAYGVSLLFESWSKEKSELQNELNQLKEKYFLDWEV